jgi:hypothetical protein
VRDEQAILVGLPSGVVLVSTALLASFETDAELVSALAHEAGHLQRGDLVDRLAAAYGEERLRRIGEGSEDAALAGMSANLAAGGLLTRHGTLSENGAEAAASRAGCPGGLAVALWRGERHARLRRKGRVAHRVAAPTEDSFPAAADGRVELLGRLHEVLPLR